MSASPEEQVSQEEVETKTKLTHPHLRAKETKYGGYAKQSEINLTVQTDDGDKVYKVTVFRYPGGEGEPLENITIELTEEEDIYFVAQCEILKDNYRNTIDKKVKCTFENFLGQLDTILKNVNQNRTVYSAHYKDNVLTFKQKLQFKTVELFHLNFQVLPETNEEADDDSEDEDTYVVKQAQFRFDKLVADVNSVETAYTSLCEHVQKQNKQLYNQLRRGQEFHATRTMK